MVRGWGPCIFSIGLSVLGFDYYFLPPIQSLRLETLQIPRLILFVTAALFAGLLTVAQRSAAESLRRARDGLRMQNDALQNEILERRRAEQKMREQAGLLDLTHDTIFVRDMCDVITFWNRGAEKLYGWSREEAVGKVSHRLTHTVFPKPIDRIQGELLSMGRWEGELIHTREFHESYRSEQMVVAAERERGSRRNSGNEQ